MRIMQRIITLFIILAVVCAAPALAVQADTVTRQCTYEVSAGKGKYLTDGDIETSWAPSGSNAKLLITLPANGAGYVRVEWETEPTGYIFAQYDVDQKSLVSTSEADSYSGISQVFELSGEARYVLITLTEKDQAISEVTVYSAGDMPEDVQRWFGPYAKCDLMVVAAKPGDEFTCFGGLVPYYAGEREANVQLVYMTGGDRGLMADTLDALWEIGIKNYPEFMGLPSSKTGSLEDCLKAWGGKDKLIGTMVETIRKCKPEVIVSHDVSGGDGDAKRQLTGMLMQYAIDAAADADAYPESAEKYGVWQVRKLYLNMGTDGVIDFDWNMACENLGTTPIEAARIAYAMYGGEAADVAEGGMFDNSVYGLAFTVIGSDSRHDDVFENIGSLEIAPADEQPEATATPEPTFVPGLVFSPEPTATPRAQITGTADDFGTNALHIAKIVGIGLGAILLITCTQALAYGLRSRKRRRR